MVLWSMLDQVLEIMHLYSKLCQWTVVFQGEQIISPLQHEIQIGNLNLEILH